MNKKKIISALLYPAENNIVIGVTRAEGFYSLPQTRRMYCIPYDSSISESFFYWYQVLQRLVERKVLNDGIERQGRSK